MNKGKIIKIIVIIIVILLGVIVVRQNLLAKSGTNGTKKIATAKVKRDTLQEKLTVSGYVDAQEKATLKFQASGRLSWIGVQEGDYVKKYQGIASLDQRDLQNRLTKYLNTYMKTRWDFEQTKDDYKNVVTTDAIKRIKEKTQFDLNNSVLDVEYQSLSKEFANLWTPIEGVVTKVDAPNAGTNITPTTAEFEIINPNSIYFSLSVDQAEVVKLYASQSGQLTLDSYPDKNLEGNIKSIAFTPKTGETGTVYEVKFTFPVMIPSPANISTYPYRLGMTGDVNFVLSEKKNILVLPTKFIKDKNVTVLRNEKKEKIKVETGMESDGMVEIVSGLTENEIIYEQ